MLGSLRFGSLAALPGGLPLALAPNPVRVSLRDVGWSPHPEVWLLIGGLVAMAVYIHRVLEPKAVALGYQPMRRGQRIWFAAAVVCLWGVSDWPVHDVAERYLYSAHMFQHLWISMLVPAMFLKALPGWLFDLLVPEGGRAYRVLSRLVHPLVAGLIFNGLTVLLHWPKVVALSAEGLPFVHFGFHLMIFSAGLLMWMPVLSPVPRWRLSPPGQCIYLFLMSVVPTVPGGWLVFADSVVYQNYDIPQRLFGIDAISDQQTAGVIMKLVGGFFLWSVIVTIFVRWATTEMRREETARKERGRQLWAASQQAKAQAEVARPAPATPRVVLPVDDSLLTYEQVAEEFSRTSAPTEKTS